MLGRNTHFTLAVHILSVLALYELAKEGPTPSAKLAESADTNPAFLRQQIGRLKEGGFVKTKLGTGGGTLLAKSAKDITLLDVYRFTEGQTTLQSHHVREGSSCPVGRNIGAFFSELETDLDGLIAKRLKKTTIQQIAKEMLAKSQKAPINQKAPIKK